MPEFIVWPGEVGQSDSVLDAEHHTIVARIGMLVDRAYQELICGINRETRGAEY